MSKPIALVVGFAAGLALAVLVLGLGIARLNQRHAQAALQTARETVQRSLDERYGRLAGQLGEFARTVSGDQAFSMKLIAESDRGAPEVSEIAEHYMATMGFSLLEVADSSMTLLSCGHFPAAAGNALSAVVAGLDTAPSFLLDNVQGATILTLQAKVRCLIAEMPVYCIGGVVVDNTFVSRLSPNGDVRIILKHGAKAIGEGVKTMSDIKNGAIVVNDTTWLATSIGLPHTGAGDAPQLLILLRRQKPALFGGIF